MSCKSCIVYAYVMDLQWIYDHYKYFTLSCADRPYTQILTSKAGPRAERVKNKARFTSAPVAERGFSHRLTSYKIVGHFFGRSYLGLE